MALAEKVTTQWLAVKNLPIYACNVHELSSFDWFGQFGRILCINVDNINNFANIQFSSETAAENAQKWMDLNSDLATFNPHRLINECNTIQTISSKQQEIENTEKQFAEQIQQFQGQVQQFMLQKQEMERTIYVVSKANLDLTKQIEELETFFDGEIQAKDIRYDSLMDRLAKLDEKYTKIFKQLVRRILETETSDTINQKHSLSKKLSTECKRLRCELNEKYEDFCRINHYVIELEDKLKFKKEFECDYKAWDIFDVYRWILSVKNGRFNKYNQYLIAKIRKYAIYGVCLPDLSDEDLRDLGIYCSDDRKVLLSQIDLLVQEHQENHMVFNA